MKILIKECKKIMDIRVLLVIAVFTVLFYHLFLEVTIYPAGGQTTDSPYDMPFYAELIESWGTSLPREDWSKLDEKRKELMDIPCSRRSEILMELLKEYMGDKDED